MFRLSTVTERMCPDEFEDQDCVGRDRRRGGDCGVPFAASRATGRRGTATDRAGGDAFGARRRVYGGASETGRARVRRRMFTLSWPGARWGRIGAAHRRR